MLPEWVIRILESLGLAGAVIFFLLMTVVGLVAYIKSLQARADKIYGYRLQERDALNKALTDNARVLEDMLHVSDERNHLTEAQSELISKQAQAFEILKITVIGQYSNIRDHNSGVAQTVGAMAEAIRVLTSIVVENRAITQTHVAGVQGALNDHKTEIIKCVRDSSDHQVREMRQLVDGLLSRLNSWRRKLS